jgi:MFS family permease
LNVIDQYTQSHMPCLHRIDGRGTNDVKRLLAQRREIWIVLVLLGVNTLNFFDRQVLAAVAEPIKQEWKLSDGQIGLLGTAFIVLYALAGVPVGRWIDRGRRTGILAAGVALWSGLTGLSALAWDFGSMFVLRLGVGIGEAVCAPAAVSLLGDLFPARRRGAIMAVFMLGLPAGLVLSSIVSGALAKEWGWRTAFLVAGLPGLVLAALVFLMQEPERSTTGRAASHPQAISIILTTPTMLWIALSGAIHNFNLYAISQFLSPLLQRYHGLDVAEAGRIGSIVYLLGGAGMLSGGWISDRMAGRGPGGRLETAGLGVLLAVPCLLAALAAPAGAVSLFLGGMAASYFFFYIYYAAVYASLQDLFEPELRGTAMAVYFLIMYLCGAALGPAALGWLSDHYAAVHGSRVATASSLHDAFGIIPWFALVLVLVLFIASRTAAVARQRLEQRLAMATGSLNSDTSG